MERKDVHQERTPEGIREDFHERIEKLRGQARQLKTLLERCERKERGRVERELLSSAGGAV
jgi:hypothetical protein